MTTTESRGISYTSIGHLTVTCFLVYTSYVMLMPFYVDVMLNAICPGESECSQVIFLTGAQQLVAGLGTVVMAPFLGSISDGYGRKPILLTIVFAAIVPPVVLAYSRTKAYVYVWLLLNILVSILRDAGLTSTALAYVADVVDESHRATAMVFITASTSVSFFAGTVTARLIKSVDHAFQVAAVLQITSAIYLKFFVIESHPRQLLPAEQSQPESTVMLLQRPRWTRQTTSIQETLRTVKHSHLLRTLAFVDFVNSFGMSTSQSFLLYYLKATFNFGKNEYAELVMVGALTAIVGQMAIYPLLMHFTGERGMLWIALVGVAGHYFIYGFAWASWVPYAGGVVGMCTSFVTLIAATSASKGVECNEQGRIQGFLAGVRSAAFIIAPVITTPLTAASLGDNPPFGMPGLPFIVCGIALLVAWFISLSIPAPPSSAVSVKQDDYIPVPTPPEDFFNMPIPPDSRCQIPIQSDAALRIKDGGHYEE